MSNISGENNKLHQDGYSDHYWLCDSDQGRTSKEFFPLVVQCSECGRIFDLDDATDSEEYAYGHDCEQQQ